MYKEKLEIRGIHRQNILEYLRQLGGKGKLELEEDVFTTEQWKCIVSPEKFIRMFQSDIPIVFVTFYSEEEEALTVVLRRFRLKTFRAGG
ncbi:hypothetical protein BTR23_20585 [Alkalihalophilus pseudofirmus]|uniref:hypothetical protein n=1 Tax=Alkalihalobacterium alkalinitrilicum TaxID=427920 RepID=UPI00094CCB50|nr:hypothetical protein [Alkalihalobacterium alkalinitrilicum]OLO27322.1 hypothetical protein BTR23_20585 [Alkalihalophilus pseudofirmus]